MTATSPEVIAVIGPTATGKTVVGASLAKALGSEVISADSQLVYKDLQIGVAAPTVEEMQGVPHHLVGFLSADQVCTAGDYALLAGKVLNNLIEQDQMPVVVGGTGFYLRALLQPAHLPPVSVDEAFRAELKSRLARVGPEALYADLKACDPNRAAQLHPNDTRRVLRALEIVQQTQKPVEKTPTDLAYNTYLIGLYYGDRQAHLQKIQARLETMMKNGFLEETRRVYARYGHCHALQNAHGYPELLAVITGQMTLEAALVQININIRQYSKRQMTWFKKLPNVHWYAVDSLSPENIIEDVLRKIG